MYWILFFLLSITYSFLACFRHYIEGNKKRKIHNIPSVHKGLDWNSDSWLLGEIIALSPQTFFIITTRVRGKARDTAEHPTLHRPPPTKNNYWSQKVDSFTVGNTGLKYYKITLNSIFIALTSLFKRFFSSYFYIKLHIFK